LLLVLNKGVIISAKEEKPMRITEQDIRENFKAYRIDYPLTQKELAEKSGISERSITRFENGGDINLSNFMKLLDALDLSDNLGLLIPDQSRRPSYYLETEPKRKRASAKRKPKRKNNFKWGDEK
jgi:transcriptional regulator with XRE-family HTH domain